MSETSLPQQRLARLWAASAQPAEMLEGLRAALGMAWIERHASELRRFAAWCARQRSAHQGSSLLEIADWYAQGDFTAREVELVRTANVSLANTASTKGLASPANRVCSAVFLASFHALAPDPYDAAVQAQRMVERYAAENEIDAAAIRREQADCLRELFGNPYGDGESGAPRPTALGAMEERAPALFAWQDTGRWNGVAADVVRQLVAHREAALALDPWCPVPQESCTFAFGADGRSLPIGALVRLWDAWPAALGSCPRCSGSVRAFSLGGSVKRAGVFGVCVICEREVIRFVDGVEAIVDLVRPVLASTAFPISRVVHPVQPLRADADAFTDLMAHVAIEKMMA